MEFWKNFVHFKVSAGAVCRAMAEITELRPAPSGRDSASAKARGTSVFASSSILVASAWSLAAESGWAYTQFKAASGC